MKRKLFTVLATFFSLALITACGGTTNNEPAAPAWKYDKTNHWKENADGGKEETAGRPRAGESVPCD